MQVVFKHRSKEACEAERRTGNAYVIVDETSNEYLRPFTTLEIKMLYRNLGQVNGTVISDQASVKKGISKLLQYRLDNEPSIKGAFPLFEETKAIAPPELAPKGGTSNLIWDVADEMWRAAGSPKDVKIVLALRKSIMQELESSHGVKKNTASNELGKWQKSRI